jgi:hypothetical protein
VVHDAQVRMAFVRANPSLGEHTQADEAARYAARLADERRKRSPHTVGSPRSTSVASAATTPAAPLAKLLELPGCLQRMLDDSVLRHAQRDTSHLFRDELADDEATQRVLDEHADALRSLFYAYVDADRAEHRPTSRAHAAAQLLTRAAFLAVCTGEMRYDRKRRKASWRSGSASARRDGSGLLGKCTVQRESDITADERCSETFTCSLSMVDVKRAFLDSQALSQMGADATAVDGDAIGALDLQEFSEALCRIARDRYGGVRLMSRADGVRGLLANLIDGKSEAAVLRDVTFIHAQRYDWRGARPLREQNELSFHRWLDCWCNMQMADCARRTRLTPFPSTRELTHAQPHLRACVARRADMVQCADAVLLASRWQCLGGRCGKRPSSRCYSGATKRSTRSSATMHALWAGASPRRMRLR